MKATIEIRILVRMKAKIIPKCVNVNLQLYIDKVLNPFLKHETPRKYSVDQIWTLYFTKKVPKWTLACMRNKTMNRI